MAFKIGTKKILSEQNISKIIMLGISIRDKLENAEKGLISEYDETVTYNTTDTDNKTTTNNLKEETTGTISDSGTNNNQESGSESTTVTTKKGGNLGVTTTQQMLTSELEFRAMYNFFNNLVYKNIDEVLTIKVY